MNDSDDDEFDRVRYTSIQRDLRMRRAKVAVLGPQAAAAKASETLYAVITAKNYLVSGQARNEQLAKVDKVRQAIDRFMVAAGSALVGHSEPPSPTSAAVPRS
jgi:hypothetical protein